MKVTVTLTVDVVPIKWDASLSDREIREDVKRYVLSSIQEATLIQESGAEVALRQSR